MNDYINKIVPIGSEDRCYHCECMIVDGSLKYVDYVGFWLSGGQLRKLWRGLEGRIYDWNIEFHFGASENIALNIVCWNKSHVDKYLKMLDAPTIFEDNDKV